MASTNQFSLFLLLITLSSPLLTHARDSQFFNKASAMQQADFLSENENSYGLYARDSSQSLPSTTERLSRNYNPVAYVTFPESTGSFNPNPNNNYYSGGSGGGMSDTKNKFYNKNFFGNSENAYEFNGEGYQTQDEFEDDEVNNLP